MNRTDRTMKLDDDIHNYYEHLVLDRIAALELYNSKDADYIADLCCVALNKVPHKYIRYEVDMAFFLSQEERIEMQSQVNEAIDEGIKILDAREERED